VRVDAGTGSWHRAQGVDAKPQQHGKGADTMDMKLEVVTDENWPDGYAAYMVAEQAGTELPT
jgi:hypothetical protein